jgi:hypothetical protein
VPPYVPEAADAVRCSVVLRGAAWCYAVLRGAARCCLVLSRLLGTLANLWCYAEAI